VLTTHITTSVGWLGSVSVFLALAIAGLSSEDSQMVRAAYLAMHLTTWLVIVPLNLASLFRGCLTPWGPRGDCSGIYWVVTKLLLTMLATILLLLHTQAIDKVAGVAARTDLTQGELTGVRLQLVGDAAAALFVLFVTTTLSVYKPWGMTAYGIRMQSGATAGRRSSAIGPAGASGRYVIGGILVPFHSHHYGIWS
jgi:hypothetical protein